MTNPVDKKNTPEPVVPNQDNDKPVATTKDIKPDVVKYETYKRTLAEAKKAKEVARAMEAKLAEIEEAKAKANDDILFKNQEWGKLVESKEQRIKELQEKANEYEHFKQEMFTQKIQHEKRKAVFKSFKNPVKQHFYDYVDVSEVAIDPETNEIDFDSARKVAEKYQEMSPEIFDAKGNIRMPSSAPSNGQPKISRSQWLSLDSKEKIRTQKQGLVYDD